MCIFLWEKSYDTKPTSHIRMNTFDYIKFSHLPWKMYCQKATIKKEKKNLPKIIDILVCILLEFSSAYDNIGQLFLLEVLFHLAFLHGVLSCYFLLSPS